MVMAGLPSIAGSDTLLLNTEMRWRAIQTGRIYVQQNPSGHHLSVDELRDMVGSEAETFQTVYFTMPPTRKL